LLIHLHIWTRPYVDEEDFAHVHSRGYIIFLNAVVVSVVSVDVEERVVMSEAATNEYPVIQGIRLKVGRSSSCGSSNLTNSRFDSLVTIVAAKIRRLVFDVVSYKFIGKDRTGKISPDLSRAA
jgi:hypothetical protein